MKGLILTTMLATTLVSQAQQRAEDRAYPKAKVDMDAYAQLVDEVQAYRKDHLITWNEFQRLGQQEGVVILDTRSDEMYAQKHIKGAIHLNFSDFTQSNLYRLIPDPNTTILIYCNNNFEDDEIYFPSKAFRPPTKRSEKALTLALNIPTFINLYGYGYREIYELDELIMPFDARVEYEGESLQIIQEN